MPDLGKTARQVECDALAAHVECGRPCTRQRRARRRRMWDRIVLTARSCAPDVDEMRSGSRVIKIADFLEETTNKSVEVARIEISRLLVDVRQWKLCFKDMISEWE